MSHSSIIATIIASILIGASAIAQEPSVIIEMTDENTYAPAHVTIRAGEAIEWTNPSSVFHTVTAAPDKAMDPSHVALPEGAEPFDSGRISPDETYQRSFDVPGSYTYFCIPHERAGMIGTIEVEPAEDQDADEDRDEDEGDEAPAKDEQPDSEGDDESASQQEKGFGSALIRWLGKFHPPSINFPIALMLMAVVAEVLFMATGRLLFDHAARFCVWFGSAGAVVSVILGWFFAGFRLSDGDWLMTTHRWLGTTAGIWALLVLSLSEWSRRPSGQHVRPVYLAALLIGAILIGLNGHFGGLMAYGLEHYSWPE